jgi:uncharacterized damage-inducible protein DinB
MKKSLSLAALLFAVTLIAHPQAPSSKPTPTTSQALLSAWDDIGRKLTTMAGDFPEEKYDFKPNPAQRTFAEQLLHAANANYFFTNPATGQKPPALEDPKRDQFKSKADIVAFVKKAFADGAAVIKSKGDAGMNDLITDPFSQQQAHLSDMAWSLIEHSGEHYGQLVVYYRVAGLVPPESRPHK